VEINTTTAQKRRRLLRIMYPNVYNYLIDKLKENNIHSFDVQMTARKIDSSVEIYVCFGERFTWEVTRTVSEKSLSEPDNTFKEFCEEIKEKCKETLVADYFKMVKP